MRMTRLVATREGGVDRNIGMDVVSGMVKAVATREGGVDRNKTDIDGDELGTASPPARVAWIETHYRHGAEHVRCVATREGGVDRNVQYAY